MNARSVCALLGATLLPLAPAVAVGCAHAEDLDFGAMPASADATMTEASESGSDDVAVDEGTDSGVIDDGSAETSSEVDPADTATDDTAIIDATDDTTADDATTDDAVGDTALEDSTIVDSGSSDTGASDTGAPDTKPLDTGTADTGTADTGPFDTGTADTGPFDTGPYDTGVADTGPYDTGPYVPPPSPTVSVTSPSGNASLAYDKLSTACQSQRFTISFTAAAGLKSLTWAFVTPDASKTTTVMVGSMCTGATAYQYSIDPAPFAGATSGTVQEDVAVAGNYSGTTSGPWWWCTAPGTSSTAKVLSPPLPGATGVQPLASYCAATTTPSGGDPGSRWDLEVTIVDSLGRSAVSAYHFWVHQ